MQHADHVAHLVARERIIDALAVPPRLDAITTYVLLEQETWFEKELAFLSRWLRPGMTVLGTMYSGTRSRIHSVTRSAVKRSAECAAA